MSDIERHTRVHKMLLGPLERPALQWLAAHMPPWAHPDMLMTVGIFGAFLTMVSYALTNVSPAFLWLASLGFVINWFGDSLDGTLARYRKVERPRYGFYVDHIVDSFSQVMVFLGLGLSPYVSFEIAAVACIGYLLMAILSYVNAFVSGEFHVSYARIGPTEMRLLAVIANTVIFFVGNPTLQLAGISTTVFNLVVAVIAAALIAVFIYSSIREGVRWNRLDPGKKYTPPS